MLTFYVITLCTVSLSWASLAGDEVCARNLKPTEAKLSEPAQAYLRLIALALKTRVLDLSEDGGFMRLLTSDKPYNPFSRESSEPVEVALAQAIETKLGSLLSDWSAIKDRMRELESQQQSLDVEQDTAVDESSWMIGLQDPLWLPRDLGGGGTVAWLVTHGRVFMSSFDDRANVQIFEIDVEKGMITNLALTTEVNVSGVMYPMQWMTVQDRSFLGVRSEHHKIFYILELNLDKQSLDHFQSVPIDRFHSDIVLIEENSRLLLLTLMSDDDKDPKQALLEVFEFNLANKDIKHHTVPTLTIKVPQILRVVKWNGKLIIAGSRGSTFRFFEFDLHSMKVDSFELDIKGETFRLPMNLYVHEGRLFAVSSAPEGKLHLFELNSSFGSILRHEIIDLKPSNYSPSVCLKQGRMLFSYSTKNSDLIILEFDLRTNELRELARTHLDAFAATMAWTQYRDRTFIGATTSENGLYNLIEFNETDNQLHVVSTFSIGITHVVRSPLFTIDNAQNPVLVVPMTRGFYLFHPIHKIER